RGGNIQISVVRNAEQVEVNVSDSGEGISAEFLPRIFDRFLQADASTNRSHSGLGLGLAIARQLVELHGGTISAASEGRGMGSTFSLTLPIAATRPVPAPAPPPPDSAMAVAPRQMSGKNSLQG